MEVLQRMLEQVDANLTLNKRQLDLMEAFVRKRSRASSNGNKTSSSSSVVASLTEHTAEIVQANTNMNAEDSVSANTANNVSSTNEPSLSTHESALSR